MNDLKKLSKTNTVSYLYIRYLIRDPNNHLGVYWNTLEQIGTNRDT